MLSRYGKLILIMLLVILYATLLICQRNVLPSLPLAIAILAIVLDLMMWRPRVKIERFLDVRDDYVRVILRVSASNVHRVHVCDRIPDNCILVEGSPCSTLTGGNVHDFGYVVKVLGRIARWECIDIALEHPLRIGYISRRIRLENCIEVKSRRSTLIEPQILSKVIHKIREPTIEYLRPYVPGDEFRLVVPKSILMAGGPRVKVLSLVEEVSSKRIVVMLIPGNWSRAFNSLALQMIEWALNIASTFLLQGYEVLLIVLSDKIARYSLRSIDDLDELDVQMILNELGQGVLWSIHNLKEAMSELEGMAKVIIISPDVIYYGLEEFVDSNSTILIPKLHIDPKILPPTIGAIYSSVFERELRNVMAKAETLTRRGITILVVEGP